MRTILALGIMLSGCVGMGCGGSLPSPPPPPKDAPKLGPHGGMAFALPNDLGYAEIVNEPPVEERGNRTPTSIVVYFLAPDARASASGKLSDVTIVLNVGTANARKLALKSEPRGDDPAGGNRFLSEAGPYRIEEIRGELNANASGTPIKILVAEGR
jgi:hypothetical protein